LLPLRVPAAVAAGVTRLAQAAGATPYMVLLTAYAALLGRYSGQATVVVGTPIANRQQVALEGLLGCVVNTLALRVELDGQPSGWALLERVRQVCLAGYAQQEAPFEQVVEAAQLPRDLSRSPIFQHMFVLQDQGFAGLPLAQLETTPIPLDLDVAHFDLTLELRPVADGFDGVLEYNTELYGAATAAQLGRHFLALLAALVAQPAAPVAALPLLTSDEIQAVQATGAAPTLPVPSRGLHQLVNDQLRRAPDALVLRAPADTWDAATLLAQVDALATALAPVPLGPEVRVGVCLERTPALLVALLAILRTGAAYVPLDPAYPADRLAFMANDAGLALVLTNDHLRDRLPALDAPVVCLDPLGRPVSGPIAPAAAAAAPAARWADVAPEQTAYLIYTSGSTGRPKAVVIPHRSAVAFVQWALAAFAPADWAGVFAATSLSFDLSVFELFVPLIAGGAVILADTALQLPIHPAAAHVTLLNTVPSVLSELLRLGPLPAAVRTVNLAGEPLPATLAAQVYAQPGVQALFNLYGPSEDTTYSTVAAIARDGGPIVPIGRPIANTVAYVCDPRGALVPPGVWGELFLGGAGLARGYLSRPNLTAEKFVPDPFAPQPGGRRYRTGDRVRWNQAGQLEYGGRLDQQVKLRGYRIELGEVAAALARQPGVADAIALVHQGGAAPQLVGYVIAAPDAAVTSDSLRQGLAASLPGYMVPAAVVVLGAWPLTPNGKLDRRALPAPRWDGDGPQLGRGPGSALERQVADVWTETLGAPPPDVETSFFAVGGHSLLATQLVARLRAACQVDLALRAVFEHPTVAELAARIEAQQASGAASQQPAIGRANRQARRVQISAQGVLASSQDKES
ncbi:MAG TPA: amino acid adenylation domain-containing protein, partial [Herpetosiphonaceae bacterium]